MVQQVPHLPPAEPSRRVAEAAEILFAAAPATRGSRVWEEAHGRWCLLPLVLGSPDLGREAQLDEVLCRAEGWLDEAGMSFADVVRTWFVVDGLLDWYADFNRVRTRFFTERGVFTHLVPASTAIGGALRGGSAVAARVLAVRPRRPSLRARRVASPLQGEALDYASAFSRAVELSWPGARRLYVSGTASIDGEGRSLHAGRVDAQITTTLDVVEALLARAGMGWSAVLEATAYLRDASHVGHLHQLRSRGLRAPLAVARAEICRDELRFELELSAGEGPSPMPGGLP